MLDIEKVWKVIEKYKSDLEKEWYDFKNMTEKEYHQLLLNFANFTDINFYFDELKLTNLLKILFKNWKIDEWFIKFNKYINFIKQEDLYFKIERNFINNIKLKLRKNYDYKYIHNFNVFLEEVLEKTNDSNIIKKLVVFYLTFYNKEIIDFINQNEDTKLNKYKEIFKDFYEIISWNTKYENFLIKWNTKII